MLFRLLLLGALLVSGLGALGVDPAGAQAPARSETGAAEAEAPGFWTSTVALVRQEQRRLHRALAGAIRLLRAEKSTAAAWSLLVTSFLYGLFHAAGPGHGKAVISTYLLTHERELKRGLLLAWAAAFVQGVTAIALVLGLVAAIGWTRRDAQAAVGTLESVSFGLIALLGAGLALRALWALRRRLAGRGPARADHAHGHKHEHGHCGHNHLPSEAQVRAATSWRASLAIILSIGIRPCSGGVLVLLFAEVLALRWAGVAAVFAMSIGTALAVSGLAILTLLFRGAATALATPRGGGGWVGAQGLAIAGSTVAMLGGILIMGLGATLFLGSLGPAHPLL